MEEEFLQEILSWSPDSDISLQEKIDFSEKEYEGKDDKSSMEIMIFMLWFRANIENFIGEKFTLFKSECPDFWIQGVNTSIGIELTRFMPARLARERAERSRSDLREQVSFIELESISDEKEPIDILRRRILNNDNAPPIFGKYYEDEVVKLIGNRIAAKDRKMSHYDQGDLNFLIISDGVAVAMDLNYLAKRFFDKLSRKKINFDFIYFMHGFESKVLYQKSKIDPNEALGFL